MKKEKWKPAIFGIRIGGDVPFPFIVEGGKPYRQCIPYEGIMDYKSGDLSNSK